MTEIRVPTLGESVTEATIYDVQDGTIAVDTTVPDATDTVKIYRVRPGDTLTTIAKKFGVPVVVAINRKRAVFSPAG